VLPLKLLGINIYNTKALTSMPIIAEVDLEQAKEVMSEKLLRDIELFESLTGNSYEHWR